MIRIFHHTLRLAHLTLWLTLVSLAVILTVLRFWLLPRIDQFRHLLESNLSQRLDQSVQIRQLKASLDGITPQLRLIGVAVGSTGDEQLKLEEIQLGLDLSASLQKGQLQPAWIRILGAHIEVHRTADGRFHVLGLGNSEEEGIPRWLLADGRFELIHSTLVWHPAPPHLPHTWHNTYIRLDNRGTEHWLRIRFEAPDVLADKATLSARLQGDPDTPAQWRADFLLRLERLQIKALTDISPIWNSSELGVYSSGQGTLQLRGNWRPDRLEGTAVLSLKRLNWHLPWLKRPLELDRVGGQIHGVWDRTGFKIESRSLRLSNPDFEIHVRLRLNRSGQESTHLEAIANLDRLDLTNLDRYLPRRSPRGLAKWLARSPLRGIARGQLLWRGRLEDFPFRDHSGIGEAWLTSRQTQIEFHPRWPALTEADLSLRLHNDRLAIEMTRGKLADAPIETLGAALDLSATDPVLAIQGRSRNPVKQILKVLTLSPLQPAITTLTTKTRLDGQADLSLAIFLPIRHSQTYRIDGQANLQRANWYLLGQPLGLDNLSGELRFTEQRLIARLDGRFRQEPAHLEANVDQDHTRLTLSTQLDSRVLAIEALRQYLDGAAAVRMALEIEHAQTKPVALNLHSDLKGLAVHLPYPVGKVAGQPRPLELTAWMQSPRIPLSLDYGPVHAALTIDRISHRVSGRLGLGRPPPPGNVQEGFILAGHLDRLPLDPWLALWSERLDPTSALACLQRVDLDTEQLQLGAKDYGQHRIWAKRLDSGWEGSLTTPYTTGNWSWNAGQNRLDFEADFVDLDKLRDSLQAAGQTPTTPAGSTANWPTLALRIRHLYWRAQDLGTVDLKALPESSGQLKFDLGLSGKEQRLEASGTWHPGSALTRINGRFTSDDLGSFLKRIGHTTALVRTPTTIDFKLDWPGGLHQFSIAKLGGLIHLDLGPGRWLDIEPGAGRLLGLLYLGTLGRRLRLDFSDLFQAGLSFEQIGGHIRLKDGLALTDDLTIAATSARIHIAGTVDLANRQVDEYVTVFPNTPVTLGLFTEHAEGGLGKMAGLAQRLFNTPLDSITQSQYAIYGTLDDPSIVLLRRSLPGTVLHGIWSELKGLTGNRDE